MGLHQLVQLLPVLLCVTIHVADAYKFERGNFYLRDGFFLHGGKSVAHNVSGNGNLGAPHGDVDLLRD